MEIVWVHLKEKEALEFVDAAGNAFGTAFVNQLFGDVLGPPKKVKK